MCVFRVQRLLNLLMGLTRQLITQNRSISVLDAAIFKIEVCAYLKILLCFSKLASRYFMLFLGLMQFFEGIVLFLLQFVHRVLCFRRLLNIGNVSVAIHQLSMLDVPCKLWFPLF